MQDRGRVCVERCRASITGPFADGEWLDSGGVAGILGCIGGMCRSTNGKDKVLHGGVETTNFRRFVPATNCNAIWRVVRHQPSVEDARNCRVLSLQHIRNSS